MESARLTRVLKCEVKRLTYVFEPIVEEKKSAEPPSKCVAAFHGMQPAKHPCNPR